jgi:hypothetical protein
MKKILLAAAVAAIPAAAALAQTGTVNAYTPADAAKARAAITAAGFTPGSIASAQGGALFVNATKGADKYVITVLPDGSVHAGTPLGAVPQVPTQPMALPPGSPAPQRAGRGGFGGFSGGD